MRLASLLPMLLLWLCTAAAQNNCQIANIKATIVQPNPNNCQFFVSLDFDHQGTTNQFNVTVNGVLAGTFTYGQLPIVLGPYNADPNMPTVMTFEVRDAVFLDCKASTMLDVPPCLGGNLCQVSDLAVQTGQCDLSGATYELWLNFQVQGVGPNAMFEVFSSANVSLGVFPLALLPLHIPAFPASGNPVDLIKVCIVGQPNCCLVEDFPAPLCVPNGCAIVDLTVSSGDCTSDSTYKAVVDFDVIGPVLADTFALWSNGQFIGKFNLMQLPFAFEAVWNGGSKDEVKVCAATALSTCCKTIEYEVPDCLGTPACAIKNLSVKSDTCSSDSTFLAILDFVVNDPSAVDSFDVWANGEYWGRFGLDQLPLHIPDFPWNGLIFNYIKVCTSNVAGCCKEIQFLAPSCLPYKPCEITDIILQAGPCTSDSTYKITLNFNATNPGNGLFTVSAHGQLIDTFALSAAPLMLELPWFGQATSWVTMCILGGTPGTSPCCRIKQFVVPNCNLGPCEIYDVVLDPGSCNPNAPTYSLSLNFSVDNPSNNLFEVWGNGIYLGAFPLGALPLTIPNFPSNGPAIDVIKICINDNPDCCAVLEFQGPDCNSQPCEITDLHVQTGDCHADSTYVLWVNFQVQNPSSNTFGVWANGTFIGTYNLSQLPLQITNFPWDGTGPNDVVKVCMTTSSGILSCCKTLEFPIPDCFDPGDCQIVDLVVDVGDCTSNDTYEVTVNFHVNNPPSNSFALWANGQFFGIFNLNQLPLTITHFPWSGGNVDVLEICFANTGTIGLCCAETEFEVPDCLGGLCEISDLTADPGPCSNIGAYPLKVNFQVQNPGNNLFEVWVNGTHYGAHPLDSLPYIIPNVPSNGPAVDVLTVCINDQPNCCKTIEFFGPDCGNTGDCEIVDVKVTPDDCVPGTNTYQLTVDFAVINPTSDSFQVWGNGGVYLGQFALADLPLTFPNFPANGPAIDVIKICLTDNPHCCKSIEFQGPNCGGNDCQIVDLEVNPGDCTSNTTYELFINFSVVNPPSDIFQVWTNGQVIGIYNINQLPLTIPDFPWGGGAFDKVKICMLPLNPTTIPCCADEHFEVPDCIGGGGDCKIYDLAVLKTPCLCGQFFAVLTFNHQNGSASGFHIVGNGNNYGNFPYSTQQPIILGPFDGDGTTVYEFAVIDNDNPDCADHFNLGEVKCTNFTSSPAGGSAMLAISPNPTANWLNVTALLDNGASIGQANVEVYAADGRKVKVQTVTNGANFQINVSDLPSGLYRLVLISDSGRLEGKFAKE